MNVRRILTEDDAVSPVIGVILMVAITVILAAVIGTFVLGLGDQIQNTPPSTSFTFEFDTGATGKDSFTTDVSQGDGILTVTHDGGDEVSASQLSITGGAAGTQDWAADTSGGSGPTYTAGEDVSAGDQLEYVVASDDTVRVTWESASGGNSATLGTWTGPNA